MNNLQSDGDTTNNILETDLSFSSNSFHGDTGVNANAIDGDVTSVYRDTTTCDEDEEENEVDDVNECSNVSNTSIHQNSRLDESNIKEIHSRENVELELFHQQSNEIHHDTQQDVDNEGYIGGEDEFEDNYEEEDGDGNDTDSYLESASFHKDKDTDNLCEDSKEIELSNSDSDNDDNLSFGSQIDEFLPNESQSQVDKGGDVSEPQIEYDSEPKEIVPGVIPDSNSFAFTPERSNTNKVRDTSIPTNYPLSKSPTVSPSAKLSQRASNLMSLFDSPTTQAKSPSSPTGRTTNNETLKFASDPRQHDEDGKALTNLFLQRQQTERINNNKLNLRDTATSHRRQIINRQESDYSTTSELMNAFYDYRETDRLISKRHVDDFHGSTGYQSSMNTSFAKKGINNHQYEPTLNVNNEEKANDKSMCPSKDSLINGLIGSFIFGLFHIVFCLAQASAITRPYTHRPSIGPMVRVASMGTVITTPFFLMAMLESFPDLYPSIDVFPAPFYVQQAFIIDEKLARDRMGDDDDVFLTTFCVVGGIGLLLTGLFLFIASKFKLANLGAFLPYPVMAGFFSTVGLLLWTLAFTVDTGKHVGEVLKNSWNDFNQIVTCIIHHSCSIFIAVIMQKVSKVNNSLVPVITLITIPLSHLLLLISGTNLDDARDYGWFWHDRDFKSSDAKFRLWHPPLPFGVIHGICDGKVHWGAVHDALPITIAMALIYFIRCSLHAPALKKNSENIQKWREEQVKSMDGQDDDIIGNEDSMRNSDTFKGMGKKNSMETADIYTAFARVLAISGLAGGTACLPSLGSSATVTKLGSSGALPQYGSAVVLIIFYLTDFELLGFIPKVTFSSLLVLTSFTMLQDWFLMSYTKIKEKREWVVVPLIAILSFTMGVLPSVFVGIAISTFIFVSAFYTSGVVKYIANGLTVHSTTERSPDDMKWLDIHGDLIQLVVLQNYLFFGNANSCFNYINTMFEEPTSSDLENLAFPLPPIPKFLVIDFTMVTGMDASAVDVFVDIIKLCRENGCKVFLSGLKKDIREVLSCGGVQPSIDRKTACCVLKIYSDMDHALRKAEDALIMHVFKDEEKELRRGASTRQISLEDGFINALEQIDSQHHLNVTDKLKELAPYVEVVNLMKGETLHDQGCGLYFIEHGIIRVERDAANTTRALRQKGVGLLYATPRVEENYASIGHLRVRTPTIGRESALLKQAREISNHAHTVRLARIGPGFVVGSMEVCTSSFNHHQGIHTAVVPCRLHLLSNESIQSVENTNPRLALELYKMMSQLSAERQAATIDQLATLQSIMVSLAPSKPVDRVTSAIIQEAMKNI